MAWQGLNCLLTRESKFESEVTECGLGLGDISVSAVPWIMALTRRETSGGGGGGGVHVSSGTRASTHAFRIRRGMQVHRVVTMSCPQLSPNPFSPCRKRVHMARKYARTFYSP